MQPHGHCAQLCIQCKNKSLVLSHRVIIVIYWSGQYNPLHTSIDLPERGQLHVAAQPTSPPNALVSKHLPLALANLDSFNSLAVLCGLAPRQRQPSPSSPTTTQHSSTTLHHSLCCIPHTSNSHLSTDCTAQSAHDCTASAYI